MHRGCGGHTELQDENRSHSPSRKAKERAAKGGFDKSKCPVQTEGGHPIPPRGGVPCAADDAQALCKIAELSIRRWGKTALTALERVGVRRGRTRTPEPPDGANNPLVLP